MVSSAIPPHILKKLARIEPGAQFSGVLPQVVSSSGRAYYAKTGPPSDRGSYTTEAESLKALGLAAPGLVPTLLAFGFVDERGRETDNGKGSPFFITEYKNMTALTERSGAILGRRLATEVHQHTSRKGFGSEVTPYYGGATRLRNGWYNTWEQYVDALIGDLLSALEARGGFSDLCRRGKDVRARRVSWFLSLKTRLILRVGLFPLSFVRSGSNLYCCTADYGYVDLRGIFIHTDNGIQSGNAGTDMATGEPVMFDASCVYGHNEAE
jgi:protein-ribulosamine 3-kinase